MRAVVNRIVKHDGQEFRLRAGQEILNLPTDVEKVLVDAGLLVESRPAKKRVTVRKPRRKGRGQKVSEAPAVEAEAVEERKEESLSGEESNSGEEGVSTRG